MGLKEKFVIFSIGLFSTISGCSLNEGTVASKTYEEQRRNVIVYPCTILYRGQHHRGKIPVEVFDDEDCRIKVSKRGKEAIFYLKRKEDFDSLKVGDFFKYDSGIAEKEDYDRKRRLSEEEFRRAR